MSNKNRHNLIHRLRTLSKSAISRGGVLPDERAWDVLGDGQNECLIPDDDYPGFLDAISQAMK